MTDNNNSTNSKTLNRSSEKVRQLTYDQLEIPNPPDRMSSADRWEKLGKLADEAAIGSDTGVAVRTVANTYKTGRRLEDGNTHEVHALKLAVWTAFSESESAITDVAIHSNQSNFTPCDECLQILNDYGTDLTVKNRQNSEGKWHKVENTLPTSALSSDTESFEEDESPDNGNPDQESTSEQNEPLKPKEVSKPPEAAASGKNLKVEYIRLNQTTIYHRKYKSLNSTFCGRDLSKSEYVTSDEEPILLEPCKPCHGMQSQPSASQQRRDLRAEISGAVIAVSDADVDPEEFSTKDLVAIHRRLPIDIETEPETGKEIRFELSRTIAGVQDTPKDPHTFTKDELEAIIGALNGEGLIPSEPRVYVYSRNNEIKRTPVTSFKPQHRNGKGLRGISLSESDTAKSVLVASPQSKFLFFTSSGSVYQLPAADIPEQGVSEAGINVESLLDFGDGETLEGVLSTRRLSDHDYVIFATRNGIVKRTKTDEFSNILSTGINAIELNDDDELCDVAWSDGSSEIILTSANGYSIRFEEDQVRPMGRPAAGVQSIALDENDTAVGIDVIHAGSNGYILTLTEQGYGKRTQLAEYKIQGRNGQGLKDIITNERNGKVVGSCYLNSDQGIMLLSSDGQLLRTKSSEFSVMGRNTMGVGAMGLNEGEALVDFVTFVAQEADK